MGLKGVILEEAFLETVLHDFDLSQVFIEGCGRGTDLLQARLLVGEVLQGLLNLIIKDH